MLQLIMQAIRLGGPMDLIMETCAKSVGKEIRFFTSGASYIGTLEIVDMATGHLKLRTRTNDLMIVRSDRIDLIILELPNGKPAQV
jgi:hypothetical protein